MKLPNLDNAVVPSDKVLRYLLDVTSNRGKDKAAFLMAFGFRIEDWQVLADALLQHAARYEVTSTRETDYGIHYTIEGALESPDGRNPSMRVVWIMRDGETFPSLVTAYPL
jgi:hypothetical protein